MQPGFFSHKTEERREPAHGKAGQQRAGEGDGHGFAQAPEFIDRRFAARFVRNPARHHEERCFIEGVGQNKGGHCLDGIFCSDAEQHHHGAERRNRGVSQQPLQHMLPERHDGPEQEGDRSNGGKNQRPLFGLAEGRVQAGE